MSATTLSTNRLFDVLASRRRRFVLQHLVDASDGTTTLESLAERVAARERREDRNVYVANFEELRTYDPYNTNESSDRTPATER